MGVRKYGMGSLRLRWCSAEPYVKAGPEVRIPACKSHHFSSREHQKKSTDQLLFTTVAAVQVYPTKLSPPRAPRHTLI